MTMNTSRNTKLSQLISYFLLWLEAMNASVTYGRFMYKAEDFDDRLLSLDAEWTHEVPSLINCVAICSLDERCVSVQFNQAATICAGYVVSPAIRPDSVSSLGYVMFFDMDRSGDTTQTATTTSGIQKSSLDQTQGTTTATPTTTTLTSDTATQTTTTTTPRTTTATPTTTTLTSDTATQTTTTTTPRTTTATPTTTTPTIDTTTSSATTSVQTTITAVQTTTASVCAGCTIIPGITCTTDTDCIEPNTFCEGGSCICPSDMTLVSRGTLYICEYAQPTCGSCGGLANSACEEGLCRCSIGYNYNPVTNACDKMENCAEFLDTFSIYLGVFSFYSEDERRPASSIQECWNMCAGSTTITCKNFEVASVVVVTCYLHQTTWFEFPKSKRIVGAGFNHYQRNCDWKAVTVGTGCRVNVDCSSLTNAECVAGKCACDTGTRLVPRVNKCLKFQEYGQACTADSDCYSLLEAFCLSGLCTCRHGYSYSPTGQYCRALKECTNFKETFTIYPDSVILLHDVGSYPLSNPTRCKSSCINSPIFCKSADLSVLNICYTSDITWQEANDHLASFDTKYSHLQRDCDWS